MSACSDSYAEQFLQAWRTHYVAEAVTTGQPTEIDLPDDWRASITAFFTAGLPQAALLNAVAITMDRENVANNGLFRYFCGVCWHVIRIQRKDSRPHVGGAAASADRELPKLPRSLVRTVPCPLCGAAPGQHCIGSRGKPREANHAERVLAADAASHAAR